MTHQDDNDFTMKLLAEQMRQDNLTDLEVLTEFVIDNADLEALEDKLRQFNIFEAIGMQKQEVRHSTFLAFLLDPQQPHGLGDDFLKKFLQRALLRTSNVATPINAVSLHLMDLDDTLVERERSNIDVLLVNEAAQLTVIIENKVDTGEHDNQLERYFQIIQRQYPGWDILALYLTIDGSLPSHSHYLPLSYADVANVVESLVVSRETVLGPDVRTLMHHYVQMLRRNLVSDAELDNLCRRIYEKHRRAIDLIVARIPDKQAVIQQAIVKMVEETPGIRLRWHSRRELSFHPEEWDVPALQYAGGKEAPALIFQFHIHNSATEMKLLLELRRASEERRHPLFNMAMAHGKPFRSMGGKLRHWNALYSRLIISKKQMPQMEPTDIIAEAHKQWELFLAQDLPTIKKALKDQPWIWDTQTTDAVESGVMEDQETEEDEE